MNDVVRIGCVYGVGAGTFLSSEGQAWRIRTTSATSPMTPSIRLSSPLTAWCFAKLSVQTLSRRGMMSARRNWQGFDRGHHQLNIWNACMCGVRAEERTRAEMSYVLFECQCKYLSAQATKSVNVKGADLSITVLRSGM